MDLSIPSGYESYSNRLDPHDEVDNGHAEKAARLSSDEQTLLKQRRAPPKPKGGALDTIRLALRVLILLVNLSILGLLAHGVNVWQATHSSIDRNDDGWVRTRWPSIKMLSTWLMLAVSIFASVVQLVALATRLSFVSTPKVYCHVISNYQVVAFNARWRSTQRHCLCQLRDCHCWLDRSDCVSHRR
ncbi:hypothetical protein SNK03_000049 [Fusarium graminearum]